MAGCIQASLAVRLLGCIQMSQSVPNILIAPATHTGGMSTLAGVAAAEPVQVAAFGDSGPGASAGMPLRAIEVAVPARAAGRAAGLLRKVAFMRAQRPPDAPAQA